MFGVFSRLFATGRDDPVESTKSALAKRLACELLPKSFPKLKDTNHFYRELTGPAARTIDYIEGIVASMREFIPLERKSFFTNKTLNALFVSEGQMLELLCSKKFVINFINVSHDETLFALITATPSRGTTTGSALVGELIQRDILQTSLTFIDHKCPIVTTSQSDFNNLITEGLMQLCADKISEEMILHDKKITGLKENIVSMNCKVKLLEIHVNSLGGMFSDAVDERKNLAEALEYRNQMQTELEKLTSRFKDPSACLRYVADMLGKPEEIISVEKVRLRLDEYGVLYDLADESNGHAIELAGFTFDGRPRVAVPVRFVADQVCG
jgi:hypothetical protein